MLCCYIFILLKIIIYYIYKGKINGEIAVAGCKDCRLLPENVNSGFLVFGI